jgi:hypothetical protein
MAPVEDAADRAVFFDAVDGFATTAIYRPVGGGAPFNVTVILDQPVEETDAERPVRVPIREAGLRKDELATVKVNDRITIKGQLLEVTSFGLDKSGEIYKLFLGSR